MDPFEGQRRLEIRAEQAIWRLVSASVFGVLVLLLLYSIALLDGASSERSGSDAPARIARPVEEAAPPPGGALETSLAPVPVRPVAQQVRTSSVRDRLGGRPDRPAAGPG